MGGCNCYINQDTDLKTNSNASNLQNFNKILNDLIKNYNSNKDNINVSLKKQSLEQLYNYSKFYNKDFKCTDIIIYDAKPK